jgi:hypothetical protein
MTGLNIKTLAAPAVNERPGFFKWLWHGILRFDEALNFDPRDDLARRIADLERKSKPERPD